VSIEGQGAQTVSLAITLWRAEIAWRQMICADYELFQHYARVNHSEFQSMVTRAIHGQRRGDLPNSIADHLLPILLRVMLQGIDNLRLLIVK